MLPLMVTLDSVVALSLLVYSPPPSPLAELPLTVEFASVVALMFGDHAAALAGGGVAADGAVGQRGRSIVVGGHAAAIVGGVAADGAIEQRRRSWKS